MGGVCKKWTFSHKIKRNRCWTYLFLHFTYLGGGVRMHPPAYGPVADVDVAYSVYTTTTTTSNFFTKAAFTAQEFNWNY